MKKRDKTEIAIGALALIPLAATLALYRFLPQQVPMHWGVSGEVDRWGARTELLGMCALLLALQVLLRLLPALDPHRKNYARFGGAYKAVRLGIALFCLLMQGASLYACFFPGRIAMSTCVTAGVGALLCLLGNFMPKFKHNYFVGVRTPWTLASEPVWYATHRLAGPVWVVCGAAIIVCAFLLHGQVLFWATMGATLLCALVPFVYSYFSFKKQH